MLPHARTTPQLSRLIKLQNARAFAGRWCGRVLGAGSAPVVRDDVCPQRAIAADRLIVAGFPIRPDMMPIDRSCRARSAEQ
jgi:hypothetical protein